MPNEKEIKPKIFLSYAREDGEKVKELYQRLLSANLDPWMDQENIYAGEDWRKAIRKAIRESDFFIACLSNQSVNKRGVLQKEIKDALDVWEEKTQDDIYLIPVRLEECSTPDSLSSFQWVDLFRERGWNRLAKAIQEGMKRRGVTIEIVDILSAVINPTVTIPELHFNDLMMDSKQPLSSRLAAIEQTVLNQSEDIKALSQVVLDNKCPDRLRYHAALRLGEDKSMVGRQALEKVWQDRSSSPLTLEATASALVSRNELTILASIYQGMDEARRNVARPILERLAEKEPAAIYVLRPELKEGTIQERLEAVDELHKQCGLGTVKCLVGLMMDAAQQPVQIRKAAALAMGEMPLYGELRSLAISRLRIVFQKDQNQYVRQAAGWSLAALGEVDKAAALD